METHVQFSVCQLSSTASNCPLSHTAMACTLVSTVTQVQYCHLTLGWPLH